MSLILSGTDGLSDVDGTAATPAIRGTDANTGIFFPAADTIGFAGGGVEAMRINASGNLGVGVTPSAWGGTFKALQIGDRSAIVSVSNSTILSSNYFNDGTADKYMLSAAASLYQQIGGDHRWLIAPSGTAGNTISFTQAMTLDASSNLMVNRTSVLTNSKVSVDGSLGLNGASGEGVLRLYTAGTQYGGIASTAWAFGGSYSTTDLCLLASNNLVFGANGAERARISSDGTFRVKGAGTAGSTDAFQVAGGAPADAARIDSSGNLLVGTTTAASLVNSTSPAGGGYFGVAKTDDCPVLLKRSGTDGAIIFFAKGGVGNVGSISVTTALTTYNSTSDYRLKTVIGPVANAGQRIDALQPVEYTWNASGERTRGFLAHQFAEVYAGSVSGTKDAVDAEGKPVYQAMQASTSEVIADLVAEIKSLRQRLATAGI